MARSANGRGIRARVSIAGTNGVGGQVQIHVQSVLPPVVAADQQFTQAHAGSGFIPFSGQVCDYLIKNLHFRRVVL